MIETRPDKAQTGLPFEDQPIGRTWRTQRRTVTEHDLMTFVTTFGFTEELFLDEQAARDLGFDGRLIPGALTLALAEGLVIGSGMLSGTGMAFLGGEIHVKKPVFVGDTIEVWIEVAAARMTSQGGRGVVTTRNEVRNQHQDLAMVFTPSRMIKARGDDRSQT